MGWEKEYEHWRDMGHTWGPGIDDVTPYTEEELKEQEVQKNAYEQKLKEYSVPPRPEFAEAGKELEAFLPNQPDITCGKAPYNWREEYSKKQIALCKKAATSLGYTFELYRASNTPSNTFSVSADYYGYLPGKGGNIHRFFASGIKNIEDCLQLVADFAAVGIEPTTYYDKGFHYSTNRTGELKMELIRRFGLQEFENPSSKDEGNMYSLDQQIQSASIRAAEVHSTPDVKTKEPELNR